jgi:hypothetical protein
MKKCIRRCQLWWSDELQEAYYWRHRIGRKNNFTYKHTYMWELWKDAFQEAGITKEDIKNGLAWVEVYPGHEIRFVKKRKGGK